MKRSSTVVRGGGWIGFLTLFTAQVSAQAPALSATVSQGAPGGYYLTGKLNLPQSQLIILDSAAGLVYYRTISTPAFDFKRHEDGRFSYFNNNKYYLTDGNLNVTDSVEPGNGFRADNHDLQTLPNGHFLLMAEEEYQQDLSAYHYFKNNAVAGSPVATVIAVVIQELDANRNVVFQWKASDHFSFGDVDPFWLYDPALVDWTHANSVHLDEDGNILLSSRHLNEITKISRTTGNVIWRFGGKKNMFSFTGDTLRFYGQHDGRRLKDGSLTLFDNGRHKISHGARALRYQLDETAMTAYRSWQYQRLPFMFSLAMGNAQTFGKSHTLVNYGVLPAKSLCFDVVDSAGNSVVKVVFDDSTFSYRSFHVTRLPDGFVRPLIVCGDSANVGKLDAGAGYLHYKWNTGDTTRFITPATTGLYYVLNQRSATEFVRSYDFHLTTDLCQPTSVADIDKVDSPSFYPNPAAGLLNMDLPVPSRISVFSSTGQILMDEAVDRGKHSIDISGWPEGLYLVSYGAGFTAGFAHVVVSK